MKIVTAAEMREIDAITTRKYGVPSLTLMENAGAAVAAWALEQYPRAKSYGVICGKGNNGGDGFVAARHLRAAGGIVRVLLLAAPRELTGDAAVMFRRMSIRPVLAREARELTSRPARQVLSCDLLLDAILGTGFRPPLGELYSAAIEMLSQQTRPVIAVDIPSGMVADSFAATSAPVVRASDIVSFTAPKPGLIFDPGVADPGVAGNDVERSRTVIAAIGSPPGAVVSKLNLQVTTAQDIAAALAPRAADSHKGDYGHVLVIGGSLGKAGAAAMAGMAALRAGAGLVTVAAPRSILPQVAAFAPELMTEPLPETSAGAVSKSALEPGVLSRMVAGKSVVALGPGLGMHPETVKFVRGFLGKCELPLVLDADGLNAFAGAAHLLAKRRSSQLVLTPHPGEMARLLGCTVADVQRARLQIARSFTRAHNVTLVLKGYCTLISSHDSGEAVWVNPTGNPSMAKAGMGDLLTGMIAARMAQSCGKATAGAEGRKKVSAERRLLPVLAAVYLHGLAGDLALTALDESCVLATDLLLHLSSAFREARRRLRESPVRIR